MLSPTHKVDVHGCIASLGWSVAFYYSPFWPVFAPYQMGSILGLGMLNTLFIYRTFFSTENLNLKKAFRACRDERVNVILGDWLKDDYDEKLTHIKLFDDIAKEVNQGIRDLQHTQSVYGHAEVKHENVFWNFIKGNVKSLLK